MPDRPSSEASASDGEEPTLPAHPEETPAAGTATPGADRGRNRREGTGRATWGADHATSSAHREPTLRELVAAGELPSRRHVLALALALMLIVGLAVLGTVKTGYIVITPGTVEDLRPSVAFGGANPPAVYEPRGDLSLVTVRSGRATPIDRFYSWFRKDIQLVPLVDARPAGETDQDARRRDADMMSTSKDVSDYLALKFLGYPVKIEGDGARVDDVVSSTAAAGHIQKDDVIKAVDGRQIALASDIRDVVSQKKVGEDVTLKIDRGGAIADVNVPLSPSSDGQPRPVVGVIATTIRPHLTTPIEVKIGTGEIGGPSAGLAFTLEIIDALTPGDLVGGHKVVATGAMGANGTVIPVGGVKQKAMAAERAGAEYFIVPRENLSDARDGTTKLEIVPVSNLDEAMAFLERLRGGPLEVPLPTQLSQPSPVTPTSHPR